MEKNVWPSVHDIIYCLAKNCRDNYLNNYKNDLIKGEMLRLAVDHASKEFMVLFCHSHRDFKKF